MQREFELLSTRCKAAGAFAALLLALAPFAARATDYTTFHFDNTRDGWNHSETSLDRASVPHVKKTGDFALDGEVDAQPLYLGNEYLPSLHARDGVAYVATENDTLYAVSLRHGIVWSRHFGSPVGTSYSGGCQATAPTIGIQGTPVIDAAKGRLYLVSYAIERGKPAYTLHAIDAASGAELQSVNLTPAVGNAYVERQRAGLLEAGGRIYVAFAGFCDHHAATTYGRVLAYDAATLARTSSFVTTSSPRCAGFHYGTIWALGFAPAADDDGNVYVSTGNGCIDYARIPGGGYSDAVLRLTPGLALTSLSDALFAPCTAIRDNAHDQEMGSGGVMLLPGTRFAIAGGKTGITFVLDRAHLGGYRSSCPDDTVFQAQTNWGLWGGPAAWREGSRWNVVVPGSGPHGVRSYELTQSGRLELRGETGVRLLDGGESAIVTSDADGTPSSAVLWVLTRPVTGTIYLQAYEAANLRRRLISVPAGQWANPNGYAGCTPTVADGHVFVATNKRLTIWSL